MHAFSGMMRLLLTSLLLVGWAVNGSILPLPHKVLKTWKELPPGVSTPIHTEDELKKYNKFVSPVLTGGLGNMMYEMAFAHAIAKQIGVPCIIAWWEQSNPNLDDKCRPYHGRGDPAPGISIKHIFPNILYVDFFPKIRHIAGQSFGVGFSEYIPPSKDLLELKTPYVRGGFFFPQCL